MSWASLLDGERRAAAAAVARDVVVRSTDAEHLAAAAEDAGRVPEGLLPPRWEPYSVGAGDAGLAIACAYLDACLPGEGWDVVGHRFLATAVGGLDGGRRRAPPGLFVGLSGLAFAAAALSRDGRRYQRLLAELDGALAPRVAPLAERLRSGSPGPVSDFDLIAGASGIAAYLLTRDPHGVLPGLLEGLVAIAEETDGPPRWMTPPGLLGDELAARIFPQGNLDCGLAHGIPGPLAVLALALRAGAAVAGQAEAVRRIADWLVAHRVDDDWGANWPPAVPLAGAGERESDRALEPSRAGWCYGSPGVARALWLAGEALGDAALRQLAVEAMLAVVARPPSQRAIPSPTFCHGRAGLLQIVLRFAHDTGHPAFVDAAAAFVDDLLDARQPDRPLGYGSPVPGSDPIDHAGLLDGAPGVAMALLAAATETEPAWDRLFLLS
jgi:lantibiotic biosynthesis protein